mmetsp:Transcript_14843/g.34469  ORF Transcript_14843/g.34469 Transcript_14843/m.34469 type:complete len:235 (+) Transcript_14843:224-928(+)
MVETFPVFVLGHCVQFHFFRSCCSRCSIHRFIEDLNGQFKCLLDIRYVFIFLFGTSTAFATNLVFGFEQRLSGLVVRANHGRLPTTVVPRRIRLIKLEAILVVISRKQKGNAKGTKASTLGVKLLVIANMFNELFDRDGLLVLIGIATGSEPRLFDQNVSVGRQTGNITRHMRAQLVGLFRSLCRCQQTTCDPTLTSHYDSVFSQHADACSSIVNSFDSVLDLMKSSFGRKCCC